MPPSTRFSRAASIAVFVAFLIPAASHAIPPKLDEQELKRWNDPAKVGKNNCYNYATNVRNDKFSQPGGAADPNWPDRSTDDLTENQWCAKVIARAIGDGLMLVVADSTPGAAEPTDSNLVALVVKPGIKGEQGSGDYHWYRRDRNGKWSHKPGSGEARSWYISKPPRMKKELTDPRDPKQLDSYKKFCAYLKVSKFPPPSLVNALPIPPSDGVLCMRLVKAGGPGTTHAFVGHDVLDLMQHFPTFSPSNEVPRPEWLVGAGEFGGFGLYPGQNLASQVPAFMRVFTGVVAVHSDQEGVPPTYYADDHGLETFVALAKLPGPSDPLIVVLALSLLVTGGLLIRRQGAAER